MTKKKPWNRIDLPVYSICSKQDNGFNMNIITYCTQISMQPKQFVCGIYTGTQTLLNVEKHPEFVLQLLSSSQYNLIALLGKKSGKQTDKIKQLIKRKELSEWNGFPVLTRSLAVMQLKVINTFAGGDHTGFICKLLAHKNLNEGNPLTLNTLREKKLIRI